MEIVTGLSGLKTAADLIRALRDGLKSGQIKGDEIAGRIGEIYDYIVDSKDALVDAKDEVQILKDKIRALEEQADLEKHVVFHDQASWKTLDEESEEGPFCPVCWSLNKKLVRPTYFNSKQPHEITFVCSVHQHPIHFTVPRQVCRQHQK